MRRIFLMDRVAIMSIKEYFSLTEARRCAKLINEMLHTKQFYVLVWFDSSLSPRPRHLTALDPRD